MPRSPNTFAAEPAAAGPVVALVVDRTRLARAHARGRSPRWGRARCRSACSSCGIETQSRSGLHLAGLGRPSSRRRVRALHVGRHLRGGDAAARHSARLARGRRPGVERCARDRALRRQVDDELPAGARRHPDAADLGRGIAGRPRGAIVRREIAHGPLVLKPLFGSQGRGLRLIRTRGRPARPGRGRRRLLSAALRRRSTTATASAISACWCRSGRVIAAMVRHAAELDHQRQAGRPAAGRRSPTRT